VKHTILALLALPFLLAATAQRPTADAVQGAAVPNDPYVRALTWPSAQLDLSGAWDSARGTAPVTVAVIDTGVANVSDLRGAVLPGIDLVNRDDDPDDDNGHGTAIASIIAARPNNGQGIAGVCGTCSILPVKVLDAQKGGRASTVAEGVRWAVAHGARVLDISLNAPTPRPELDAALNDAIAQGVTVVISAGNGGSSNPAKEGYPAASVTNAIRVAATTKANGLAGWSNRGGWVDIAAPGWATALRRSGGVAIGLQGTSYAAPYVAGIAALLLTEDPTLSPAEVKSLILVGGTPVRGLAVASSRIANAAHTLVAAETATALAATRS
jgi:subtilisin family serine protease